MSKPLMSDTKELSLKEDFAAKLGASAFNGSGSEPSSKQSTLETSESKTVASAIDVSSLTADIVSVEPGASATIGLSSNPLSKQPFVEESENITVASVTDVPSLTADALVEAGASLLDGSDSKHISEPPSVKLTKCLPESLATDDEPSLTAYIPVEPKASMSDGSDLKHTSEPAFRGGVREQSSCVGT